MVADALDDKAKRVLEAVWKAGGEADTSEIREYTGLTRGQIQYRVDGGILEEEGLVESRLVSASDEGTGNIRVSSLTERGDRIAGRVMDDADHITLEQRVEELAEDVRAVEDLAHRVDGHLDKVQDRLAEIEAGQVETLGTVDDVLDRLAEEEDIVEAIGRPQLHVDMSLDEVEEQYEAKIAPVEKLAGDLATYHFAIMDLVRVLDEAGLVTVSEYLEEELFVDDVREEDLVPTEGLERVGEATAEEQAELLREAFGAAEVDVEEVGGALEVDPVPDSDPERTVDPETAAKLETLDDVGMLDAMLEELEARVDVDDRDDEDVAEDVGRQVADEVADRPELENGGADLEEDVETAPTEVVDEDETAGEF